MHKQPAEYSRLSNHYTGNEYIRHRITSDYTAVKYIKYYSSRSNSEVGAVMEKLRKAGVTD